MLAYSDPVQEGVQAGRAVFLLLGWGIVILSIVGIVKACRRRRSVGSIIAGSVNAILGIGGLLLLQPALLVIIVIGVLIGALVFSLVAVIKAFTRRTTAWIVAGCMGGLVLALAILLILAGLINRFESAGHQSEARLMHEDTGSPNDLAFPLRKQAWRMAGTLVHCGFSQEEAREIALWKMPGLKPTDWWKKEVFPRLTEEHQRLVEQELKGYNQVSWKAKDDVIKAYLGELAIWETLQQEKKLSIFEVFDLWHGGIVNQTDEWWRAQLQGMSEPKRNQLNQLRQRLLHPQS